ncbi:hypothetical protein THRCLA_05321 [Thraustotheca clavata]|uniref:Uncharacterized protein n=1 Tax=Thraustotheca clavata TaxID=74557 RepID=A0A1V9ZWF9_9STRA|nr:hypothetical protein THRCLA_05321 [Thraustotheca clavata]
METMSTLSLLFAGSDHFVLDKMSSPLITPCSRGTKRRRVSHKEELGKLEVQCLSLQSQLDELLKKQAARQQTNPWQAYAIQEAQAMQKALHENMRLKDQLKVHEKVASSLERIYQKRPKLEQFIVDNYLCKRPILGIHNREEMLEKLMKDHYDELDSQWIRHDMLDAAEQKKSIQKVIVTGEGDAKEILAIKCATAQLNYKEFANIVWKFKQFRRDKKSPANCVFHPDLTYGRDQVDTLYPQIPNMDSRCAVRRYFENNRVVIVWKSIVEDKLYPHKESQIIEKHQGWFARTIVRRYVEENRVVFIWKAILADELVPLPENLLIDNRFGWTIIQAKSPTSCNIAMNLVLSTPVFPESVMEMQPVAGTWTELLLRASNEHADKFNAILTPQVEALQKLQY